VLDQILGEGEDVPFEFFHRGREILAKQRRRLLHRPPPVQQPPDGLPRPVEGEELALDPHQPCRDRDEEGVAVHLPRHHIPGIEVTVYGASERVYERVTRRPGSFAAFRRGLDRLRDSGVRVRLKAMVLRSNLEEWDAIGSFCAERTKDFSRSDPFLCLRTDFDPARNREIQEERLSPGEIVQLARRDERLQPGRAGVPAGPEAPAPAPRGPLFRRRGGEDSFFIGHDGTLRLCGLLNDPSCRYDLRQGSLAQGWHDFLPRVRETWSHRLEYLDQCGSCDLALTSLCRWCPAKAQLETGGLDLPVDYFCRVAHAMTQPAPPGSQAPSPDRRPVPETR
jgi:MoaA/NifB/PqqE/SkfB family radical SAM enzyme